jgi:adenine deaminase
VTVRRAGAADEVDPGVRARAVRAALGEAPFDVLLTGGRVVDVSTGGIREADVGLVGNLIASVHPAGSRSDSAAVLDCSGRWIAPGLIDMHVHVESSMMTPAAYAEAVCPRGTTTIFTDPHELANVLGVPGVRWFCDASRDLPVRFVVQAPSCVPPLPGLELSGADLFAPDIAEMLSWPEVGGLAEVMDVFGVVQGDDRMSAVVRAGLDSGKVVSGHAAGLAGAGAQAYLAAGISSDHEITSAAEGLDRLRDGFTVELRGIVPQILDGMVEGLLGMPDLPVNLVLATDDLFASTLLRDGGIDELLRQLVARGLPPVRALRLATLNAAVRLGRSDLGLVAAGRLADLVVLDDLATVSVGDVVSAGRHVASGGKMVVPVVVPPNDPPTDTIKLRELTAEDFQLRLPVPDGVVRVRVVHEPVLTSWATADVQVRGGVVELPPRHLLQVALHRHGRAPAVPAVAVISGWGEQEWTGAIATTLSHDTHNLVVFGRDPDEMLAAARTVVARGGGIAVVAGREVLAEIALPIAGLLSPAGSAQVAAAQRAVEEAALGIGMPVGVLSQPLFQVLASTLPCIPGPHLTDLGLVDGDTGTFVHDLVVTG